VKNLFIIFSTLIFFLFNNSIVFGAQKKMTTRAQPFISAEIKVNEESTVFGTLKIKFIRFGHEHSSSGPGEPFSANTGVYEFSLVEGTRTHSEIFYTNAEGESNVVKIWEHYEIKMVKATGDQKTVTLKITNLKP
jgi:hypothetical protein